MDLAVPHGMGNRHSERFPGWITLSLLAHLAVFSAGGYFGPPATRISAIPRSPAPLTAYIRPVAPAIEPVEVPKPTESETQVVAAEPVRVAPPLPEVKREEEAPAGAQPRGAPVDSAFPLDLYLETAEVDIGAEPSNEVFLSYPWMAYAQRLAGKVTVRLLINERGELDQVAVIDADPPGIFESAALEAVHQLQFVPARKNGREVKSRKTIEVVFDPSEHLNHPAPR
jgi:protein TonB